MIPCERALAAVGTQIMIEASLNHYLCQNLQSNGNLSNYPFSSSLLVNRREALKSRATARQI